MPHYTLTVRDSPDLSARYNNHQVPTNCLTRISCGRYRDCYIWRKPRNARPTDPSCATALKWTKTQFCLSHMSFVHGEFISATSISGLAVV